MGVDPHMQEVVFTFLFIAYHCVFVEYKIRVYCEDYIIHIDLDLIYDTDLINCFQICLWLVSLRETNTED